MTTIWMKCLYSHDSTKKWFLLPDCTDIPDGKMDCQDIDSSGSTDLYYLFHNLH